MKHKSIIKVSFNEDAQKESIYFFNRLIEKIIMDELELPMQIKGAFLQHNQDIMKKE